MSFRAMHSCSLYVCRGRKEREGGGRESEREGWRVRGREGEREGGRVRGREGGRKRMGRECSVVMRSECSNAHVHADV